MMTQPAPHLLSRRRLLRGLLAAGVVGATFGVRELTAAPPERAVARTPQGYESWRWDDPRAWSDGRVPGPDDHAVVTRPILVEGHVEVASIHITPQGALIFAPYTATQVNSRGNVVVEGRLTMRPDTGRATHTLRFVDVDEAAYVGGHTDEALQSDIGLWILTHGVLDSIGTAKTPWLRLAGSALEGDTSIVLASVPQGWQVGDRIVVTPTAQGDHVGFSERTIRRIDGARITLEQPLDRDHPALDHAASGTYLAAEVANLTRDVVIEGTPHGRAHVQFLHQHEDAAQTIRDVELRHLGPRQTSDGKMASRGVTGRYALHFHHCGEGSRDSRVEGVVAHHCGNNAFVPHLSNGVTLRKCVAYDIGGSGFWWDPPEDARSADPTLRSESNDILYDQCLSMKHWGDPNSQARQGHTAFSLVAGVGNAAVGCVAVGVQGNSPSSGFQWPSKTNHGSNVWRMESCLAHNNAFNGIFVWQNDTNGHITDHFTAYHCGKAGIEQGAYANPYHHRGAILLANGGNQREEAQLVQHSNGRYNDAVKTSAGYAAATFDTGGVTDRHILSMRHNLGGSTPVEWVDCTFLGAGYVLELAERDGGEPAELHFVRAKVGASKREMKPSDVLVTANSNGSVVRIQQSDGTAWKITDSGTVTQIDAFHTT